MPPVSELGGVGSNVTLHAGVLTPDEASALFEACKALPGFVRKSDDCGPQSRLTAYFGDEGCSFWYVGLMEDPEPWPPALAEARDAVQRAVAGLVASRLTGCLANRYRTGDDHIPWHADEVRAHGAERAVAALSLGTPREFLLRRRGAAEPVARAVLEPGSVLLMRGDAQERFEHCLPPAGGPGGAACGERISLTFRTIVPHAERGGA